MIVYNETFIIEDSAAPAWLEWIKAEHIPAVMETGIFGKYLILTVIDSPNEGFTYCIQYHTDTVDTYSQFHYHHMPQLHEKHATVWENQFVLFTTVMETVD